jgi:antitoxin component of MazEF toxin-antitoxin module
MRKHIVFYTKIPTWKVRSDGFGNLSITIPKKFAKKLHLRKHTELECNLIKGELVYSK